MSGRAATAEDARLELLERLLAEEGLLDETDETPPERIAPRAPGVVAPLSFAQARLWFLDRWQPGNSAYHLHLAIPLAASIDAPALARSLEAVVARHEALRTTFEEIAGRAVQIVAPRLAVPLPRIDLAALGREAAREAHLEVNRVAAAAVRRPFDLTRGPLLRALLARTGDGNLLVVAIHHIVADGWSLELFARELTAFYRAYSTGAAAARIGSLLPSLPIQYPDFALWQRAYLADERLAAELAWWREQLAGAPTVLDLPADRPRPVVQSFRGAVHRVRLEPALAAALRALARERGATLFMALLAGFGALLARYADQEDLLIGTPIANRNRTEVEGLIGFFVNTLLLRVELSGTPSGRELIDRVRVRTFAAYEHQDLPFEKLVEELRPERELSRQPLCQVVLGLQSGGGVRAALAEDPQAKEAAGAQAPSIGTGTAKFDLSVQLAEGGEGVRGGIEYRTDLFERPTIERLAANFETVLRALVTAPDLPLAEAPLLAEAEARQLAVWGAEQASAPVFSLVGRFAEQAATRPDALAVDFGEAHLTYGELARRAGALAGALAESGVLAGDRVGLCLERSLEMVIAILGTLAAGAAYVPLDPHYPQERLSFLLEDSGARVLLTESKLLPSLPPTDARILLIDAFNQRTESPRSIRFPHDLPPELPAYVIYTSGSTGKPKGVVVTHAHVARLFTATDEQFGFGPDDVWTLFHSYAFDFSVWEIWGALLYGGRLTVVPYWTSRSPEAFHELLGAAGTTVLNQTPSAFRQLDAVDAARSALPALRTVVFGGEALDVSSFAGWFARHGDARPRLVNMFGITETTVHVTYREVTAADLRPHVGSPIGAPIADLSLRVLDRRGLPCPIGVPGEICVGGAGPALGYLGRPELSAARFVPDVQGSAGSRLYRSGDLGRYLGTGEVEHLGRADFQVKVRGFRIELGEIASALGRHPRVGEAVAILHQDALVAYWVAREAEAAEIPAAAALREHLRAELPEHMVPARLIRLDRMPLTAHGKIDRRALPAASREEREGEFVPPRTPTEETLAAIWSRVLDLSEVGANDNFFALGGDSIRSLEVLALARERGLAFELQDLFRLRTLGDLAAFVNEERGEVSADDLQAAADRGAFSLLSPDDSERLVAIADDAEDAYPLARLQAGMLHHMTLAADEPPYHNVDSWRLRFRLLPGALARSIAEVAARHPAMRTSFHLEGFSEPIQIVHRSVSLPLPVADLRALDPGLQAREIARYGAAEKRRLFDLGRAPQLRFFLHRLGGGKTSRDEMQLTITENHAIFDGWSLHTTLSEIFDRYFARLAALPDALPSLPPPPGVTFRHFVALERAAAASPAARDFWARQLDGATMTALPPAPAAAALAKGPRMRRLVLPAPVELSAGLRRLAREAAVPLKSLALAAHLRTLSVVGGTPDVVTGVVSNGRPEVAEAQDVRGLFLNSLPLRLDLAGGTWRELIDATFRVERDLLRFRRFPLADLQQRRGGALFEVLFNYIHFHVIEDLLRGGQIEVLGFSGREGTNYPLQVVFTPGHLDRGVQVTLEYDARRLSDAQAAALGRRLFSALSGMVAAPEARYDEDPLLDPAERRQLALDNATAVDFGPSRSIADRIVDRAAVQPDSIALSFAEEATEHLSYGELERASARLARRLRRDWRDSFGERRVVVVLDRSLDLAAALLAVLRAGAAYVPIDPDYPEVRRAWMLEDSRPDAVITSEGLAFELPAGTWKTIVVAAGREVTDRGDEAETPLPPIAPEALAYLIYTSGSTGRPKGAGNAHSGIENRLLWMQRAYGLDPSDTVAQKTPASFDVSVWEFFWPLMAGARLAVAKPGGHRDAAWLAAWLPEQQVTTLHFVPSMLRAFLETPSAGARSLRRVIASGEALPPEVAARFLERFPDAELHNLYGPTEAAVDVTAHACRPGEALVPIGGPIANLGVHLLDVHGEPVPPGTPGELFIGGAGVGRGYANRPDLTAERFVPDPFGTEASVGARLYRTGDLARRLDDGEIEFLGRLDHQVKIRGLRIELGEIEAALGACPEVAASLVIAAPSASGDSRLAAYIVPRDSGKATEPQAQKRLRDGLIAALAARLPDYMVPADWVILPEFPLSPNGKLDRRALPRPEDARVGGGAAGAAPRTPTEELLATIWSELLGLAEIGREQSFFDLGGHSLLAGRLAVRVRALFGVDLALPALFAHPTLAALAHAIDRVRATAAGVASPPLRRAERQRALPLSFAQERLWFLDRLEPGSPAYNVPLLARLTGRLAPAALGAALAGVVERHEILRTSYPELSEGPVQRIDSAARAPLPTIDLAALAPESLRESTLDRLARRAALLPFDLADGPVLRSQLFRLAAGEHALLLVVHHIATDGGSHAVLLGDLAALYASALAGRPSPLPPLGVQYADFTLWQRARLEGAGVEREIEYWRERLAGRPPLALPADRPRPRRARHRGDVRTARLAGDLRAALVAGARSAQTTLFMAVAAAFHALLFRWTGQARVALGTPIAGRDRAELEPLIGLFVNTVVLAVDCTEGARGASWRELLARVRAAALGAYAHADVPFDRVVEELEPERDLSRTPLFQAMVQVDFAAPERAGGEAALPELQLAVRPLATPIARFELSFGAIAHPDALALVLGFDSDLFDPATAERMLGAWRRLLASALAEPDRPIAELPLLSPAELHQVAIEVSDTHVPAGFDSVPAQIFRQAGVRPDAVAIHLDGEHLSFGELERRARRLAARLAREFGVREETLVALATERTPAMLIGLLAIWRTGGAYLPLDPTYPAERLAFMLADSGAPVLITEGGLLEGSDGPALPTGLRVLRLDEEVEGEDAGPPVARDPLSAQLAYVIYTSGSTGKPKGVAVPHGALANFLGSMAERPGLAPGEALLAVTSLSFDIAGLELWLTLSVGGRIELATRAEAADGRRLRKRLQESGASALQGTPATWRLLIDAGWSEPIRVLVGGETLPDRLAAELCARSSSVWNLYGPTETTIWSAVAPVAGAGGSIGRPIGNTRLAIVDRAGEPAAVGVAGELWIGGEGVARGYLGRPDLTAERFVPDPYARETGCARAYRTGDLVRWHADGTVEFLGRIDAQVKVRGHRIELGEVEAALAALPEVTHAVAAVRGEGEAKILVGYLVPAAAIAVGTTMLRSFLARTLPDSMIPGAFVGLDAFPLTPNGKVDRRALPAPEAATADLDSGPPSSAIEEVISTIFAEVLGRERVGAGASFFDLGGHSLLATRAMVRIAEAFGVEVPLVRMFERPTAAGLAEVVCELRGARLGAALPPLSAGIAGERPPLSFAQQRLWLLDRLGLAGAGYNLPLAARLAGPLPPGLLRAAICALADRHEVLRTSLPSALGEAWQEIAPRLDQPLVEADLAGLPDLACEPEARRLLSLAARAPFDLAAGPLCRALAVKLGERERALLLVLHHTAADGWSMNVALADLAEIVRALAAGEAPRLPALPIRYADFAAWQRAALGGEALAALLAHWRERLAGLPTALALPIDRARRTAARTRPAGAARVALGAASTAALSDLARRQGATPFIALFAGFAALLARVTGQHDFALGTPIAGRTRRELEPMIGFFANTLVLRAELSGEPSFADLLGRARSTALDAYDAQELPFERLVEELRPERDLAVHPLFQVMFQMQVASGLSRDAGAGDLAIGSPIEVGRGPARFDLILSLGETGSEISGLFEYDPDLFDPPTVIRLAERFSALVAAATAEPLRPLFELPLLSDPERQQTIIEWSATATAVRSASPRALHAPIVAQAELRPDAVALSCGGEHLSYGALERRSGRLARRLRELAGESPVEPLVAVALERSIELPLALVAVLRAGAAYVPIDPEYPAERQAWMLEDARPIAVVTTRALAATLPPGLAKLIWVEEIKEDTAPTRPIEPVVEPESLAYTIFTSGSTGRPKGAMNSHRAIANRLAWMQEAYGLTPADVVAQKTPASFDVSVWELFWPLRMGARMALAPPGLHRDAAGLARWIAEEGVTTIHFVPSMLRAFLDEAGVDKQSGSLRRVIASGEALSPDLARRFHERLSGTKTELHNLYGPTEAAVDVTFHACRPGEASVPIGRPIAHLAIHLVDAHGFAVPAGSPGELWIGGVGLGRGYLHRPDLSAERFVPDLFGAFGGRLYRTGDLARHRSDGAIEYLGRIDHQVKIRGVRIELGEIEAALDALPEVAQAVVLLERAESRLIAYLVGANAARPEAPALRAALARRLPEALLPAVFVWLDALPLSPSGKVDRRALPAVAAGGGQRAGAGVDYVPPSSALEELIAAIYAELLGLERLGVRESFFDLGGHSLLATRAAARLSEALGLEVPLARLFERPSVGALASALVAESAQPRELERSAALALDLAQMSDDEVAALLVEYERRAPGESESEPAEEPARAGEAA